MPYQRVTYEELALRYQDIARAIQDAPDSAACLEAIRRRYQLQEDMTPMELCSVRHDMDVNDPFYAREQDYYDEIGPQLADLSNQLDRLILASPYRSEIEALLGSQALVMMEERLRGFDSRLIPLSREENELKARHIQVTANIMVSWEGEQVNCQRMIPFTQSSDRETRRRSALAVAEAWQAQRPELEALYSRLVENRHRQAQTMGFSNYMELSYLLMDRIGYSAEDVRRFREQVKRYLVPLLTEISGRRRERLGLDQLRFYDAGISFPNGNPTPIGDTAACLEATREMYARLSPETGEYIDFMLANHLYDVEVRDGKRGGGYMAFFAKYRSPFIFANFDGTIENAYIMCHEGGHAFQGYLKRNEEIRERCWASSEAAETHAMSMEFFAWPYMELFFGPRAEDYRTMHLESALQLVARQCLQDEFQELVYRQPDMTPQARNSLWRTLEQAYCPYDDPTGNPYLEQGCGWQRIPHFFQWPFYAIDYALAQVCALEYLRWMELDFSAAWDSYLSFCRRTGEVSFPQLVRQSGLDDPFAEGTLSGLVDWLRSRRR